MNKFFSVVKNINPLKYKRGWGLVANPPPPEVFLSFFFFFFQEDKTSASDAFSNCSFISRAF